MIFKLFRTITFRVCVLITFFAPVAIAQDLNNDSLFCLEVRGRIVLNSKSSGSYKVKLFWNNLAIDSHTVKGNKPFVFHLKRDEMYGIVISKKGYYPRLISIDTRISEADKNLYLFDFETTLLKKSKSKNLDKDALDYPIAIVAYDDRMIGFYYNEEYTSEIKRDIFGKNPKTRYTLKKM
jgi:hypothetical protein